MKLAGAQYLTLELINGLGYTKVVEIGAIRVVVKHKMKVSIGF